MGLFTSKPGLSSTKYTSGYRGQIHRELSKHSSHSVAEHKLKLIDGGIKTITIGGSGRVKGRATPTELRSLIDNLGATGEFTKHELEGLRKVFSKELAQKDTTSRPFSLFGSAKGISEAKFSKNTFTTQSVKNQISTALGSHDSHHKKILAGQIEALARSGLAGGEGREAGRLTKAEVDSILASASTMGGYTPKDIENLQTVFYRALGEKSTNTAKPQSQKVEHSPHTTEEHATPTSHQKNVDTHSATTRSVPPVMHAPHLVLGKYIESAATATPWKERANERLDSSHEPSTVVSDSIPSNSPLDEGRVSNENIISETTSHEVQTLGSAYGTHNKQDTIAPEQPQRATSPAGAVKNVEPLSPHSSFKERLAKRREEHTVFSQQEQRSTQLTHAGHDPASHSATRKHSTTSSFKERLEQRKHEREQLNKPQGVTDTTQASGDKPHAPSFSTHTTFEPVQKKPSSHDNVKEGTLGTKEESNTDTSSPQDTKPLHSMNMHEQEPHKRPDDDDQGANQASRTIPTPDSAHTMRHNTFTSHTASVPSMEHSQEHETITEATSSAETHEDKEGEADNQSPTVDEARSESMEGATNETDTTKQTSPQVPPDGAEASAENEAPHTEESEQTPALSTPESKETSKEAKKYEIHRPLMKLTKLNIPLGDSDNDTEVGQAEAEQAAQTPGNPVIDFTTNLGSIAIEVFLQDMPHTAGHFLHLAKHGFYKGVKFHRVVEDYVIQAGEPSAPRQEEAKVITDEPKEPQSNMCGTVSVVTADKNAGGGVFSINVVNNVILDGRYPVIGRVIAGMGVVEAISKVPTDSNETPKQPVVIESVSIS